MRIKEYGLKDEKISNKNAGIPAQVITTYRERYEVVCDMAKVVA